jgi:hypothetical protein
MGKALSPRVDARPPDTPGNDNTAQHTMTRLPIARFDSPRPAFRDSSLDGRSPLAAPPFALTRGRSDGVKEPVRALSDLAPVIDAEASAGPAEVDLSSPRKRKGGGLLAYATLPLVTKLALMQA